MVDSCRSCGNCRRGLEQYGEKFPVLTYNGDDKYLGGPTFGGYSECIAVDEAFTLRLSASLDSAASAPLLCAGITTYSPLRHWKIGPGQKVGIVGLGGLGHMGVKFARALGAHVVLFTTSPRKTADALRLGAHEVVVSKNADEMRKHATTFDFLLDAVSAQHDINAYLSLLKLDGTLVLVGAPEMPLPVSAFNLIMPRRQFAGSGIGGIPETQEMLDFCAERGITCDIEMIAMDQINTAYERLLKGDVKYRFVIDMATLKSYAGAHSTSKARYCSLPSRSIKSATASPRLNLSIESRSVASPRTRVPLISWMTSPTSSPVGLAEEDAESAATITP
jgi:uncharacterized zinc-type alcohol dehydrogenase-like protein